MHTTFGFLFLIFLRALLTTLALGLGCKAMKVTGGKRGNSHSLMFFKFGEPNVNNMCKCSRVVVTYFISYYQIIIILFISSYHIY